MHGLPAESFDVVILAMLLSVIPSVAECLPDLLKEATRQEIVELSVSERPESDDYRQNNDRRLLPRVGSSCRCRLTSPGSES